MIKRRWVRAPALGVAATLILMTLLPRDASLAYSGAFYEDVATHWARPYIRTLWEEEVTPSATYFRPDVVISRRDFGEWMVRCYPGGVFPPPEAALRLGDAGSSPQAALLRQQAVATLIEALGLAPFAASLDQATTDIYLRQFYDRHLVSPDYRSSMALAVRLKIIHGYPDRTLQPLRPMTRAEGATTLYRSCLMLVEARPNPFSPDGDGVEDVSTFRLGSLRNRNLQAWCVSILDSGGGLLRSFESGGAGLSLPDSLLWDGRDGRGRVLPVGTYYYQGWLKDRNGLVHHSVLKPVVIEEKRLTANVYPRYVAPGGTVSLTARTAGGATRVEARIVPSTLLVQAIQLAALRPQEWRASVTVPKTALPGRYDLRVTAYFHGTTRQADTWLEVRGLGVTGMIHPNPTPAGREVTVTAWTTQPVDECLAHLSLRPRVLELPLCRSSTGGVPEAWTGTVVVPGAVLPGRYPVTILARRTQQVAREDLWLEITEGDDGLTFVLSD